MGKQAPAIHPCSIEGLVLPRCVIQLIPGVLSGIDRVASWPNRSIDSGPLQEVVDHPFLMGRALSSWKTACCPIFSSVGIASCRRISSRYWRSVRLPCTLYTGVLWCRRTVKAHQINTEHPQNSILSWMVPSMQSCPGRLQTFSRLSLWFREKNLGPLLTCPLHETCAEWAVVKHGRTAE